MTIPADPPQTRIVSAACWDGRPTVDRPYHYISKGGAAWIFTTYLSGWRIEHCHDGAWQTCTLAVQGPLSRPVDVGRAAARHLARQRHYGEYPAALTGTHHSTGDPRR